MSQRVLAVLSTASSVVLACFLLMVAAGIGCGRTGLDDVSSLPDGGPEPLPDGQVPDTGPASCNSATCTTGCCDAARRCVSGSATSSCGTMGRACVDCQAGGFQYCDSTNRVCVSNVGVCSPRTCPLGCCEGNSCVSGTGANACGSGGQACQPCGAKGLACLNGQCARPSCGPDNCAGCCLTGQCLLGTDPTACGEAGLQCANCAASGGKCLSRGPSSGGSCVGSQCNAANCSGCCESSGVCQSGFSQIACGARGQSCVDCLQIDGRCVGQQCTPPPPPICGPWNCAGCCDSAGVCQVGVFDNECGSSGASCFSCEKLGEKCLNQQCAKLPPVCNARTCIGGCCDAQGICQPGFSDLTCGDFGNACQSCLQFGDQCVNQQCLFVPDGGVCNAQTCKGCCDPFNNCLPGGSPAQCGTFGTFCQNCMLFGNQCSGGMCTPPPPTCAQTCVGCCDGSGKCEGGFLDNQCGEQGGLCADCTALTPPSTCDLSVSPRACTSRQTSCPSAYAGCAPSLPQPPTLQQSGACATAELQNGASACATGAHSNGCNSFLSFEQTQNPACGNCLAQFAFDFDEESGILACVAPVVDGACNHNSACINDCTNSTCGFGCVDQGATTMCLTAVRTGACQSFYRNPCLSTALGAPAAVCDPNKYANFGAWLQAVGNQYCH